MFSCKSLRELQSFKQKSDFMKGSFAGQECVIFSCGPSFKSLELRDIEKFCENKKVACIKQSQIKLKEITDFHFINDNNFLEYVYHPNTLKFASSGALSAEQYKTFFNYTPDLFCGIDTHRDTTASDCNFDDFSFGPIRRWGPGIMYETVLPTLLHMGFSKLYINGWDYTTADDGTLKHFYDEKKAKKVLKNPGAKIGQLFPGEKDELISSTSELYSFCKSIGVEIFLISEVSELSSEIPRINIK